MSRTSPQAAVAWLIARLMDAAELSDGGEIAFAGAGLLTLAVRSKSPVGEGVIADLAVAVSAAEHRAFDGWGSGVGCRPNHWLLRTSHHDRFFAKWIALGGEWTAFKAGDAQCRHIVRAL